MKLGYGTTSWPVLGLCGVPNSQVFLCSIDAEFAVRIWDTQSQSCLLVYKIQHALSSTSSTHLCAILRTTPIANGFHLVAYIKNTSIKNPVHYIILKILNSDSRTFFRFRILEYSRALVFLGRMVLLKLRIFKLLDARKKTKKRCGLFQLCSGIESTISALILSWGRPLSPKTPIGLGWWHISHLIFCLKVAGVCAQCITFPIASPSVLLTADGFCLPCFGLVYLTPARYLMRPSNFAIPFNSIPWKSQSSKSGSRSVCGATLRA